MRIAPIASLLLVLLSAAAVPPVANGASTPLACTMVTDYSGYQSCQFTCLIGQRISVTATPVGGATVAAATATCGGASASCYSTTRVPCTSTSAGRTSSSGIGTCENTGPLGNYAENQITCTAYYDTGPNACGTESDVVVCNTPTGIYQTLTVQQYTAGTSGDVRVAGHVDIYTFTVNSVEVSIPCVTLEDPLAASCAAAGGEFKSRLATLVDHTEPLPGLAESDVTTVTICTSSVTVLVVGVGVDSAPAFTVC